jgi:hypothetical protein
MKPTRKEFQYSLLAFCLFVCIAGLISFLQNRNLVHSHKRTNAVVTDVVHIRNSGGKAYIEYKFYDSLVLHSAQASIHCQLNDRLARYLRGRQISIVYRPERPGNSRPLLRLQDFHKYSIRPTAYDSSIIIGLGKVCD